MRFAFVAGLGVVLLLFPLNRWLAARIEAASAAMMECKDLRIKRVGELLKGIRQIKIAAWEASFVDRVRRIPPKRLEAAEPLAVYGSWTTALAAF